MSALIDLLQKFDQPIPRYTSYPTAPEWKELSPTLYQNALKSLSAPDPLSLYFHLPFCHSMCLFCGCSVILNRDPKKESLYVDYIIKEIERVSQTIGRKQPVAQLHFGGGTPTKLDMQELKRLYDAIHEHFAISDSAEVAIEIDPRTVFADRGQKLKELKELGFNRVSFGVQDTNEVVQATVRRKQSLEMTQFTFQLARELQFESINLDLIYGLPHQTPVTFQQTIQEILNLRPDRIALFSYAKVPWLKAHQSSLKDEWLPSVNDKFQIYVDARKACHENGYVNIGMDHFALKHDELSLAYQTKRLQRNFQGYTVNRAENHLGLGVTAIGYVKGGYFQNCKTLESYYQIIDNQQLPIFRGKILNEEDQLSKWTIHELMCNFSLFYKDFEARFGKLFSQEFSEEITQLEAFIQEGFVESTSEGIFIKPLGELFVRNIAATFDRYLKKAKHTQFSKAI